MEAETPPSPRPSPQLVPFGVLSPGAAASFGVVFHWPIPPLSTRAVSRYHTPFIEQQLTLLQAERERLERAADEAWTAMLRSCYGADPWA